MALVNHNLPKETSGPSSPAEPEAPQVVGGSEDASIKDLPFGTTVDNSSLEVTVSSIELGPQTASGSQLYTVVVDFSNTGEDTVILYATQWMLELSNNERLDTDVGTTIDGVTLTSNFEAQVLEPGERFTGRLNFAVKPAPALTEEELAAGAEPEVITLTSVLYMPSSLAYNEELLVSWKIVDIKEPEPEDSNE